MQINWERTNEWLKSFHQYPNSTSRNVIFFLKSFISLKKAIFKRQARLDYFNTFFLCNVRDFALAN